MQLELQELKIKIKSTMLLLELWQIQKWQEQALQKIIFYRLILLTNVQQLPMLLPMETGIGRAKEHHRSLLTYAICFQDMRNKVHSVIDKFPERGVRSLALARQEVPERAKQVLEVQGNLLVCFDPSCHDSVKTIRLVLKLGLLSLLNA
ncbi:hypothetical protein SUGI_0687560 [Cryptomeria japonica]|nr:hypothetical protein SUGI_0687560 [Cryptomeria japonica]